MKNLLIIDATGERANSKEEHDAILQTVIAEHLTLSLDEVQAAWITVGLVGGMEGVTLPLVRDEVALLVSSLREQGRELREMCLVVIIFQEFEEGAVVAANCAFTSRVQRLTGWREPRVIGVVQTTGKRGWMVEADFPVEQSYGDPLS
jgi:hypothetical protein